MRERKMTPTLTTNNKNTLTTNKKRYHEYASLFYILHKNQKELYTTSNVSIIRDADIADVIVCLCSHFTSTPCTMSEIAINHLPTSHALPHHHLFSVVNCHRKIFLHVRTRCTGNLKDTLASLFLTRGFGNWDRLVLSESLLVAGWLVELKEMHLHIIKYQHTKVVHTNTCSG